MHVVVPCMTEPRAHWLAAFVACVIAISNADAASVCSIDHAYPEVSELSVVDGRLVATLGSRFSNRSAGQRDERVRLALGADQEWARIEPGPMPRARATANRFGAVSDSTVTRTDGASEVWCGKILRAAGSSTTVRIPFSTIRSPQSSISTAGYGSEEPSTASASDPNPVSACRTTMRLGTRCAMCPGSVASPSAP